MKERRKVFWRSSSRNARGREYFTGTDGVVENTGLEEDYTGQGISGKGINWVDASLSLSLEILLTCLFLDQLQSSSTEARILLIRNGASFPSYLEINYFLSPWTGRLISHAFGKLLTSRWNFSPWNSSCNRCLKCKFYTWGSRCGTEMEVRFVGFECFWRDWRLPGISKILLYKYLFDIETNRTSYETDEKDVSLNSY